MKPDQTMGHEKSFWTAIPPAMPGRDLFYSGTASLALHTLVILLVIAGGNLFSAPARTEPVLKVSLVTLSGHSMVYQPVSQDKRYSPTPFGNKRGKTVGRKTAEGSASKIAEIQAQEKRRATLVSPVAGGEEKIMAPIGSDSHARHHEAALRAAAAETAGQEKRSGGPSLGQSSGHADGRMIGNNDLPGDFRERPRLAHSRYRQTPPPVYPQAARRKGYEGLVLISVEILENGTSGKLVVKKSSGYEILDQAALSAVRKWKFIPAEKDSLRIRSWGDVPIRFVLKDAS